MDPQLEITFRDIASSAELETLIRECVTRLGRCHDHIIGCHVTVELKSDALHTGNVPNVLIDVQVPDETISVGDQNGHSGDVPTAVRHAFDSAVRQVEEYKARRNLRVELCGLTE